MRDLLTIAGIIAVTGLLIYAVVAWEIYRYHECKKVGHDTFYCLMMQGK